MSKSVVRSVKNVTKGYTSVQVKVRNSTSNDAWGPTGAEMSDIAQMTYNRYTTMNGFPVNAAADLGERSSSDFYEIMDMLDKRLNDKGKNWRHVLKSLKVLDYCLHEGSELVVTWARKNIYVVKTLREFQYVDEDGRDVGLNVRQSAKELTSLILDEERLRAERHDRKLWKSRVTGLEEFGPTAATGMGSDPSRPRRERKPKERTEEEDLEYRLALEASKNEMEEDRRRRAKAESGGGGAVDDADLARAIKLSKEEEELRRRELEQSNAASLFDDSPVQQAPQATGWNQGYQQQSAVDWFGNPVEQQQQQQPQATGYLNNVYAQPTGFQPQQTGFQNGYGFNPYGEQQQFQQQQPQQPQYLQSQPTAFNMNNPYSQQPNGFDQSQQQQPQDSLSPGTNNPWSTSQNDTALAAQPTGSNNPFASSFGRPQPAQQSAARAPSLNTLSEQKPTTSFSSFSPSHTNNNAFSSSASAFTASNAPQQQQLPPQKIAQDPHTARLNALLATGEGQDTFGNVGNLRIPAQHTAPSTFVNSAATTLGRLQPVPTGTNPFMQSHMTGFGQAPQQMPAQTGGPGGFGGGGYGSAAGNPFGTQRTGQPQSGHGGSLIDL